jgi:hypothetical protein
MSGRLVSHRNCNRQDLARHLATKERQEIALLRSGHAVTQEMEAMPDTEAVEDLANRKFEPTT